MAERLPKPAEDLKHPIQSDEDVESLMKAFEEIDDRKAHEQPEKEDNASAIGSMLEESLGELDRAHAAQEKENEALAKTNIHELIGRSSAKAVRAVVAERLGEAMIVANKPEVKAYGMYMAALETVRKESRAPSLDVDDDAPERKQVAMMVDDFIRQELREAFQAVLKEELEKSVLEREKTRIQQLMDAIARIGS